MGIHEDLDRSIGKLAAVTTTHFSRARGRPRKLSSELIIDTAVTLISEEGYAALSTRSLAHRLDVRSSTLYSYFPTFDEIAETAVSRMLEGIQIPDLASSPRPVDALVTLFADLRSLLILNPDAIPARVQSRPWEQMIRMVNALLSQFLSLGLTAARAAACYEALVGVTMASAATARRAQQAPSAEIELLLKDLDAVDTDALLSLREWARRPEDERFEGTVRELVIWLLPMLGKDNPPLH